MNEYRIGDKVTLKDGRHGRVTTIMGQPEMPWRIEVEIGRKAHTVKMSEVAGHVRAY